MAPEKCTRPDCDAPIVETKQGDITNKFGRVVHTVGVAVCDEGHERGFE